MKYSAVILAFVAAVAAQSASELAGAIPACAKPALDEAAGAAGCEITDYACQCGEKKQDITISASPKVVEACGTEAAQVLEATNALCEFVAANPDSAAPSSSAAESAAETTSAAAESTSGSEASQTSSEANASIPSGASSKIADAASGATSAAAAATSAVAGNAGAMNAVNMGAMLGAAGVVAAMI